MNWLWRKPAAPAAPVIVSAADGLPDSAVARLVRAIDEADHMVLREVRQDQHGGSDLIDRYVTGDDHNLIVEALRFYAERNS